MDPVTLYNPVDFTPIEVTVPAEAVRLRAAGYRDTKPFDPGEHNLTDVQAYLAAHPEDTTRVLRLEAEGRKRVTLLGDAGLPEDPNAGDTVDGSNAGGDGQTAQDAADDAADDGGDTPAS